jgi:exodeoxyribonuclease VII large subunit
MDRAAEQKLQQKQIKFEATNRLFDSLNYKRVLDRGFAVVRNAKGQAVTHAAKISTGDGLDIEFSDAHVAATATGGPPKKKPRPKKNDSRQGTLL